MFLVCAQQKYKNIAYLLPLFVAAVDQRLAFCGHREIVQQYTVMYGDIIQHVFFKLLPDCFFNRCLLSWEDDTRGSYSYVAVCRAT